MEAVTILRASTSTDAYGATIRDWSAPTETAVSALAVAPRMSAEPAQVGRAPVVVGLTVHLSSRTVIERTDRMLVRGETWEVDGEPMTWSSPFTAWTPGIEVALKRVGG